MSPGSDSDSDIEILDSRVTRRVVSEQDENILQDLESIEQQSQPSSLKVGLNNVNIPLSQGSQNQKKRANTTKSLNDSSCQSPSNVELVIKEHHSGKRKRDDSEDKPMKHAKSSSEVQPRSTSSSLSTSEMILQMMNNENSSSSESEEETAAEPVKTVTVQDCVQSILNRCSRILPPDDFTSIQKKMMKHESRVDKIFHTDQALKNFLHLKWSLIDSGSDDVFVHIKDVVDELKRHQRDSSVSTSDVSDSEPLNKQPQHSNIINTVSAAKKRVSLSTISTLPSQPSSTRDDLSTIERILNKPQQNIWNVSEASSKSAPAGEASKPLKTVSDKHIVKLEKALEKCAQEIKKCEEAEIDWDDEDSNFVMADKWKKKFMAIYDKLAEYRGDTKSLERFSDKKFVFTDGKYPEVNKKIEKFVNKTKGFPDFWDIKRQIEKVNTEQKLLLTEMQMHTEAERVFILVGKKLKRRRNHDDGDSFYSYLKPDDKGDPAVNNPDLNDKLRELGKEAEKKINKVFEEYVEKQAAGVVANVEEEDDDADSVGDEDAVSDNDTNDQDEEDQHADNNDQPEDSDVSSNVSNGSLDNLLDEDSDKD